MIARLSPSTLFGEVVLAVLNPTTRTLGPVYLSQLQGAVLGAPLPLEESLLVAWPQIVALISAVILLFVASYVAWDEVAGRPVGYDPARGHYVWEGHEVAERRLAPFGAREVRTASGSVRCRPEFDLLAQRCRAMEPAVTEAITVVPAADPRTHSTQVRIDLPEDVRGIYPGVFARAHFSIGHAARLMVPREAVVRRSELTAAYVVGADGAPQLRQLRLGTAADERGIEVLAGLRAGEAVALDPVAAGMARATADKRRVRMMLGLVTAADRDPSLKPRMRAFIKELRGRIAPMLQAAGLEVTDEDMAFVHTVVVGAAVLQLARDSAQARREARAVLERAVKCVSRR